MTKEEIEKMKQEVFKKPEITEPAFDPPEQQKLEVESIQEDKQEPEIKSRRLPAIVVNEQRYLQANDLDGRYRLAQAFYKSGMCPKGYKDAASVFAGMELACELGLKPFTALKNIAVINGNPSIWGDLPLSLVRRSGLLEKITEILLDKDYKEISWRNRNLNSEAWAAVCITCRKGNEADLETIFTMDMAKHAGLLSRDNVWKTYPRRMLQMRARSQNLKDGFGDILMGIDISEYSHNYFPVRDVGPGEMIAHNGELVRDVAGEINKTLETH